MMFGPRRDESQRFGTSEPWIVEECSAFLTGRYRRLLEERGHPIPAWAWVNALAHGSEEQVARMAAGPAGADTPDGYVARLARHTRHKVGTEHLSLRDVQRTLLVPLELALASHLGSATADETTLSLAVSRELVRGLEPLELPGGGEHH